MINISHIKPEWIKLIESFPTKTPTLEIVAACMNEFGAVESDMTFFSWGLLVRTYLKHQKQSIEDKIKSSEENKYPNVTTYTQDHPIRCEESFKTYSNINDVLNFKPDNINDSIIIEKYINHFNNLKVSNRIGKKAPHKYVLLISIFNLIGKGIINTNLVNSSSEIETEFMINWNKYVPIDTPFQPHYATPFWYMKSEPFWRLYDINGKLVPDQMSSIINPIKQRREIFAELNVELFRILNIEDYREFLISHLISLIK